MIKLRKLGSTLKSDRFLNGYFYAGMVIVVALVIVAICTRNNQLF